MKLFTRLSLSVLLLLSSHLLHAQVGIGTKTPDSSAILDVTSKSQGFLLPRMAAVQRDAISKPATGLMIFCADCGTRGEWQGFDGTNWVNIVGASVDSLKTSDDAVIAGLQKQISDLTALNNSYQTQITNGNNSIASLQAQLDAANAQTNLLTLAGNTKDARITALQSTVTTDSTQLVAANNHLTVLQSTITTDSTLLVVSNTQVTSLQSQLDGANKSNADLQSQLSASKSLDAINSGNEAFSDFATAGITGADASKITVYNTAIAASISSKGRSLTLTEVQAIINSN